MPYSVSFESTPPAYSSVNEPLVYVVYGTHATDPITYPNFKYVADLYVNSVLVYTAKDFPKPGTNRGVFDFSNQIRQYVTTTLAPTSAGVHAQEFVPGQWATQDVVVKISEEYDGTIGGVVATDSARVFFNHYNGRYSDFTKLAAYANKPITARPVKINLTFACAKYYIPIFRTTTAAFTVDFTVPGGAADPDTVVTPTVANTMQLINIAPGAMNVTAAGAIASTATSYTVAILGVTYLVTVLCPGKYTNYYIHFLNSFGGFETMLFNKVRRRKLEIEKKSFRQLPYRVDASGVNSVKAGDIMHPQATTFAGRFKEGLKLSTDWLSDAEYTWLADLVNSIVVLLEDAGTLWYIQVSETNYDYKENIVDSLTNLAVQTDFGTTYKTQFQ